MDTLNVYIFACLNFRRFDKTGGFTRIWIPILGMQFLHYTFYSCNSYFFIFRENMHSTKNVYADSILSVAGKTPLLVGDMLVNFWDILSEASKSSASWDMGGQ